MSEVPSLCRFDYVMVNSSAGKDSQTALRQVVLLADRQLYPRERIVVVHADLGRMEWPAVPELAREQAEHYGLEFHVVKRRRANGEGESLLDYVRRRGKWPSSTNRYCTSDFKRAPCARVMTMLGRRAGFPSRILNVYGFRAEESPARAKRVRYCLNERASTKDNGHRRNREVWDWLPIHEWTERQVWDDIRASKVRHHPAYDLGMPRLSCCFCIFAPKAALMIAGKAQPELLNEYVQVERETGHTFRVGQTLLDVQESLARNESVDAAALRGAWNM